MAEFLEARKHDNPDSTVEDGFANMGKPIPAFRRQAAYDWLRSLGLTPERADKGVSGMCAALERDKPYDAMQAGMLVVDLTGTYRLMAVLLTSPKPRVRIRADV